MQTIQKHYHFPSSWLLVNSWIKVSSLANSEHRLRLTLGKYLFKMLVSYLRIFQTDATLYHLRSLATYVLWFDFLGKEFSWVFRWNPYIPNSVPYSPTPYLHGIIFGVKFRLRFYFPIQKECHANSCTWWKFVGV